jgi:hypothetical protein
MTTTAPKLIELYQNYNSFNDVTYKSDKNSYHTYIDDVYEEYLKPYRNKKINVLEIGVAYSGSIRLWLDYFKYAKIYGVDNFSCGPEFRNHSIDLINGEVKRVNIIEGNAYTQEIVDTLPDCDIIIDDGPHSLYAQQQAIELYLPKLKEGGTMFIEDIPIDFDTDLSGDDLENHSWMVNLLEKIPNEKYSYQIFDLRKNAANLGDNPSEGRGDNIILAIKHTV